MRTRISTHPDGVTDPRTRQLSLKSCIHTWLAPVGKIHASVLARPFEMQRQLKPAKRSTRLKDRQRVGDRRHPPAAYGDGMPMHHSTSQEFVIGGFKNSIDCSAGVTNDGVPVSNELGNRAVGREVLADSYHQLGSDSAGEPLEGQQRRLGAPALHAGDS